MRCRRIGVWAYRRTRNAEIVGEASSLCFFLRPKLRIADCGMRIGRMRRLYEMRVGVKSADPQNRE
jgi:hypothetical protein